MILGRALERRFYDIVHFNRYLLALVPRIPWSDSRSTSLAVQNAPISLAPNFGKVDAIMVRDEQQLAEVREKLTNNNFR